jgi:omega-amidase
MQDLKIALVQSRLHWEDIEANLVRFEEKLNKITEPVDIVVLPEMFSTGFSMNPAAVAEPMNGKALNWMRKMATEINTVIMGSLAIEDKGMYYNRMIWMQPDGNFKSYDKRHLFSMAGEEKVYTSGSKKLIVEVRDWKICPMVCYDLRFPVWIRNVEKYDVLIFSANWPDRRIQQWRKLLQARAIENQCFVLGLNVVGTDGNDFTYTGHSMAVDTMGEIMTEIVDEEKIEIVTLNHESLKLTRRYMPFLDDRDEFRIVER